MDKQPKQSSSVDEAHSQLRRLESQATNLQTSLNKLTALLSARTGSNTSLTAAHTSLSSQLSQLVLQRDAGHLEQSHAQLMRQMQLVREHLDALGALARGVDDVKNTVLQLETRVASRLARARAAAVKK
ncbi:hypothetical protein BWQ96_03165 [Gracilariopsis chorda]|uniref:Uncharacterized protein n=1 Tax=Gracilariopsis chorda TaxID=448386 RepID=A0A2V3IY58_9FLOR|nr:hypothetical protein BWQ96_03165 [Gracilariopsis chorda]|eukprot:PXF47088.1 hypothetical protein BWQ96_03165 [Gracilariopsis chorda]